MASQSSSSPQHTTSVAQRSSRPPAVVSVEPAGSTDVTRSRTQVQPSGTTSAIGRSSEPIEASPEPT